MIYDGDNLKDTDPRAKSYQEYRDYAGVDEGMSGVSTRFAFKILSKVFNFDSGRGRRQPGAPDVRARAADRARAVPGRDRAEVLGFIKEHLSARYAEFIGKEIQTAYLESYSEYGQNIFDRYVTYADYWIQDQEYRDTDTGEVFDRAPAERRAREDREARRHLEPEGLPQRDRQLRAARAASNAGKNPAWTSYEKLRVVIEKKMFSNTEELLPVISFNAKASADEAQEARELRQPHGAEGLHAEAGAPALRVVPAGEEEQLNRRLPENAHAPADHRSSAGRQEQVDRQPRAVPAPLPGTSSREAVSKRRRRARHPRHREGRGHPHRPSATSREPVVRPRPGRRARDRPSRATRSTCAATTSSGRRAARARQRQRPGGRFRRGRGRFRLPPHQGRVHADLLRRPRAAAADAHADRRDARAGRATAPATRTDGHAEQPVA